MATEAGDCSSFQANCLPTGSISFGRFEGEPLSWERRSSFSHNRYLEEVEKYSTPGSVTKKKAYFEAHFKRTALRNLDSTGNQYEIDGQKENDLEDQASCVKDFWDRGNGELHFEDFEKDEDFGIQFSWYDETPNVSDEEQHEVIQTRKKKETLPPEFSLEVASNNDGNHEPVLKPTCQLVHCDETIKTPLRCDTTNPVNECEATLGEQKLENEVKNVNSEKMDVPPKSSAVKDIHISNFKNTSKASLMAKVNVEQKSRKVKSRMVPPAVQTKRKVSTETIYLSPGMSSAKVANKTGKEIPVRSKQSSSRISPSTCSGPRKMNFEDSNKIKAKARTESTRSFSSEKQDKTRGVLVPPSISRQPGQVDGHKSKNRDKRVTNTMKLGTKMSGVIFSFKSDERAEKRKEFYVKLEEKQQSKEVAMNEIQARKREEKQAEIKQLRKSLKFKAAPMPSFYHDAGPKVSDGKKAVNGPPKSLKLNSSSTTGKRDMTQANLLSLSRTPNPQAPSTTSELSCSTQEECLATSKGDNGRATASIRSGKAEAATALKQAAEPDKNIDAVKKEDRTKSYLQQQQGVSRVKKRDEVSKVRRSSVGKVIKGMAVGSVAVHVTS